jgi:hypothetical protein
MTADLREQALAAVDRFELFVGMNLRPGHAWDPKPDLALVRDALTPPLPADLAEMQARIDADAEVWSIYGLGDEPPALRDRRALVAELAESRARPKLTAPECVALIWPDSCSAATVTAARDKLRGIAEGAGK